MIIKSKSRKWTAKANFRQLKAYIDRKAVKWFALLHNFNMLESATSKNIIAEFEANAKLIRASQRHNICYHEFVSLKNQKHIDPKKQRQILIDLAQNWLAKRAPNQLAYWKIHIEKEHTHIHLIVSSNWVLENRRTYYKPYQMLNFQCEVEKYAIKNYPELKLEAHYQLARQKKQERKLKRKSKKITPKKTQEEKFIESRGQITKKHELKAMLEAIFTYSKTKEDLLKAIKKHKITLKKRWKNIVAIHNNEFSKLRCRLATLWISEIYKNCIERIENLEQSRNKNLEQSYEPELELELW